MTEHDIERAKEMAARRIDDSSGDPTSALMQACLDIIALEKADDVLPAHD